MAPVASCGHFQNNFFNVMGQPPDFPFLAKFGRPLSFLGGHGGEVALPD